MFSGRVDHTSQTVGFKIRNNGPPGSVTKILKNQSSKLQITKCTSNYKINVKIALLFPKNYIVMTKVHEFKANFYEATERSKTST